MNKIAVPCPEERLKKEVPQLASVLREMKTGLDVVRSKVEDLTTKAKGFSIEGHPVIQSLVEIRLFLEKIRPIDKKLQYQIQKLTRAAGSISDATQKSEDLSKYRPNPDMLINKAEMAPEDGVYQPPKFAPMSMEDDRTTKQERNAARKEKHLIRQATEGTYMKEVIDELEDRPEEIRDVVGAESKELKKFRAQWERREKMEEELFARAPRTREEKKREKHLKKSRNGLLGLTENFYDDIKFLPMGDKEGGQPTCIGDSSGKMGRKLKKRKVAETDVLSQSHCFRQFSLEFDDALKMWTTQTRICSAFRQLCKYSSDTCVV